MAPALGLGGLRGPASKHPFRQSAKRENAGTAILVPDCPVFRNSLGIFAAIRRASSGAVRLRVPRRSKILAGTMFPINCSLIMVPGDITHHSFNRGADDCGRSVAHNSCQRLGLGLARRMGMGGVGLGLAAGALIGSAIAASSYGYYGYGYVDMAADNGVIGAITPLSGVAGATKEPTRSPRR